MSGKNKGGREIRKPKQPKKPKPVETSGSLSKSGEVKKPR
jgi:hypothetical protein